MRIGRAESIVATRDSEHACQTEPDLQRNTGRRRNRLQPVLRRFGLHLLPRMALGYFRSGSFDVGYDQQTDNVIVLVCCAATLRTQMCLALAPNRATINFERHLVPRKVVGTLILDLDNTLFDWFAVWYASLAPIYSEIPKKTNRAEAEIQADIRNVHRTRRTSEYTFLLEEIEALTDLRHRGDIRAEFRESIELSRQGRDLNLKLYQSVFRSLWRIKDQGTKIVAYTVSMAFYSAYRLKRFGSDGVIDVMFSPEDHDMPSGVSVESMRRLPEEFYELQLTESRHTPPGELKPNPRVLLDIIKAVRATIDRLT